MKTSMISRVRAVAGLACALTAGLMAVRVAPAAVAVYGEASCSGPTITVNVFADVTNAPLISFGVRVLFDPQALSVQSAVKNLAAWYFSDGTNRIAYLDPDTSVPGEVLIIGGKLDGLDPLQGVMGRRTLLGSVNFTRLANQPLQFGLALGRPAPFANFVTTASAVLDAAPDGVALSGVQNDPNDTDLNGLPDAWELRYFGSLGVARWDADPDGDGFNNLQEYLADTNPTNSASYPHMLGASLSSSGLVIRWQAGVQATQFLQRCLTLTNGNNLWLDIITNPPPTPITGSYTDLFDVHTPKFYRLRITR